MTSKTGRGTTWRWALGALFAVLWSFALLAGYFGLHKPASGAIVRGLLLTAGSLLLWLLVALLAAALGRRLVGERLAAEGPLVRLALSAGLGLGLLSVALMVMGLLGLLARWQVLLALLGLSLFALPAIPTVWRDARSWRLPRAEARWQRWFLFYGLASLGLTLLLALAPPVKWDSLVYHLTASRLYLEAGHVGHPIDLPYLGFPALGQMHFLLAQSFGLDRAAALFHFGYGLLALVITVALARRSFGETAGWYAAIALLSVPGFFSVIAAPYVDVALLFYTSASFYLFLRWRDAYLAGEAEQGWLALLGLFLGFAGGLKYTAVATPLALALSILWAARGDGLVRTVRRVLLVALVALLAVAVWLLENWLTAGNPLYPFFSDQGIYWDAWRNWWFDRPGTGFASTAPWRLLTAPFEATIAGSEGSALYDATVGPLLLMGVGLLAVVWRELPERRLAGHMLLLVGLNYVLWLYGLARSALLLQSRLLFPIFGLLAVLAGAGFAYVGTLRRPQLDAGWLVRTVVAIALALLLFIQAVEFLAIRPLPVLVGLETRDAYERRQLGVYADVMAALNELPAGSRVLFLWEPRSYACREVECLPDSLLDRFLHQTHHEQLDARAIAAGWQAQGFTHVLWHETGMRFLVEQGLDPFTPADLATFEALQARYLQPVTVWNDSYTLYRLNLSE